MSIQPFAQQLVHDWKGLCEADAAIAPIQLIIECLDRSCGNNGHFRLENDTATYLHPFDWNRYFEDRVIPQRRAIRFNYDVQSGYAEAIGLTIASFTRETVNPTWLICLSECFRAMAQLPCIALLVAQLPAFWIFELNDQLTQPMDDDKRERFENVLDHVVTTMNDIMTSYAGQVQFVTTFHSLLTQNLAHMDVERLAPVFVKFISFRNDKVDTLALSNIFKVLSSQSLGYEKLVDVCSTRAFVAALNEILDKRGRIAVLRYAYRIAITLQE